MLRKIKIGALVTGFFLVLEAFGITLPFSAEQVIAILEAIFGIAPEAFAELIEGLSQLLIALGVAWKVRERRANTVGLIFKD